MPPETPRLICANGRLRLWDRRFHVAKRASADRNLHRLSLWDDR